MKSLGVGIVLCSLVGLGVQVTAVAALWSIFLYAVVSGIVYRLRGV